MRKLQLNHNTETFLYTEANWVYLSYKGCNIKLDCGTNDSIEVYQDKEYIYVYCENGRMPYAALSVFNKDTKQCDFDLFYEQHDDELDWLINSTRTPSKIRFLCQWWGL